MMPVYAAREVIDNLEYDYMEEFLDDLIQGNNNVVDVLPDEAAVAHSG
jgi:hypothetical protein